MQAVLEDFLKAVRSHDITVSSAESIEAGHTFELIGFENREILKYALSATLAKNLEERESFSKCFDGFFSFESFKERTEHAEEEKQIAQELAEYQGDSELVKMMLAKDQVALSNKMKQAAREVGITDIWFFTQKGIYSQKIMKEMGSGQIGEEIAALSGGTCPTAAAQANQLRQVRKALQGEVQNFVEQQLAIYGANTNKRLREEFLTNARLSNVERRDFHRMHEIVRKMAKRLSDTYSKKRKQTQRGQLDFRKTMRKNVAYDGVPFETFWRTKNVDKPKIVAICDVSGSVSDYSRFLLLFLYSLKDVLSRIDSFAFSGSLVEVNTIFDDYAVEQAIEVALKEGGGSSTDYGQTFMDLKRDRLENANNLLNIDNKTSVIILGDARNNYGDPRTDILKLVFQRAKRVIWLNPEPVIAWNTGDSEMDKYRPYCHLVSECSTIKQLNNMIDDMLKVSFG